MLDISVMAIASWDELIKRLETEDPAKIDIVDYIQWTPDSPDLPSNLNSMHEEFFDKWYSILERCPGKLKAGIQNVFLVYLSTFGNSPEQWANKNELPMRAYQCRDSIWDWVHSALSPDTVKELATHAAKFDVDLYEPYFRAKRKDWFSSFERFKKYAQAWLAIILEAADFKAGLIITIL